MTASITSGQKKQVLRLFEDGAEWALELVLTEDDLGQEEIQRLLTQGDRLKAGFPELIRELARGRYADEEVDPDYTYPPEYTGPKPIQEQVERLLQFFPNLDAVWALGNGQSWYDSLTLPDWVEGPLVYVWWECLGGTYPRAVQAVFERIAAKRSFYNHRSGQMNERYLRQHPRTVQHECQLKKSQPGDLLIVPSQAGLRWRGKSVRRARELFVRREFGLGWLAEGCRALTHPERFILWKQLHVDCAGDEFSPVAVGAFCRAPCLDWDDWDSKLCAVTDDVSGPYADYGTSSAVLPQSDA